jgi:type I restriction enzyme S subunit
MREMTASNIGYLKDIPSPWSLVPGKTMFVEVKDKNTDGSETTALKFTYGEIVQKTNFDATSEEYVAETIKAYNRVNPDDVVINGLNLNYDFVSQRVAIVREKGVITSAYVVLRPRKHVNPHYLNYLLKSCDNIKVFHGMGEGIRQTIKFENLAEMQLLCPERKEQDAIVRYLDSKCAAIDEAIERHKKIIEKLDEYKQTQIFKEMSAFPRVIPTKRVFKIYAGATPQSAVKDFWDGSIIWITPADFKTEDHYITQGKRNITQTGYDSCNTTIVPAGSLVVSKRAPIGTVGIAKVPLCTNQGCLSCVLDKDADAEFFYYALIYKNKEMQQLGAGTTFQEISATAFANMKLPYTQIEKQKIVSERLNMLDKKIQSYKEKHEIVISKLEEYRKSIIYHAVTGKIDCRKDEQ